MSELDTIAALALALAEASSASVVEAWQSNDGRLDYKADGSAVTACDLSVETLWRERIRLAFPQHEILGEEHGLDRGSSAYAWILDPIDGTRQFGTGLANFASLIGVCRDGVPILGIIDLPLARSRYSAVDGRGTHFNGRQVRCSDQRTIADAKISLANPDSFPGDAARGYERLRAVGALRAFDGGALSYGALSRGLIDVCLNGPDLDAYDICPLCPIVTEAGGRITDWSGGALTMESAGSIVASANDALHAITLDMLKG